MKLTKLNLKLRKIHFLPIENSIYPQNFALVSLGHSYISISHQKLSIQPSPPPPSINKKILNTERKWTRLKMMIALVIKIEQLIRVDEALKLLEDLKKYLQQHDHSMWNHS